jgi:hypothetical protein
MINPAPLFIVMGTILALLAVQRVLSRTAPPEQQNKPPQPAPVPPRPRGRPITEGLSVTGIDERGIAQLKQLIRQGDEAALTTFLAFNRPGFIEIEPFLQQLKNQLAAQTTQTTQTTTQDAIVAPAGLQFAALTKDVRQKLLSFEPKSPRLITRELMARFGGQDFSSNFAHYAAREKSVTLHFPPFDPDRRVMEALVKSGIARKGRHIPLAQRLTVLKMSQLRQMAKDLNLDKKFTQKQKAAAMLAEVPGAAVLLSMQYVVDDLFTLNPINEDCEQVKDEWAYLTAYAKLLSTLKLPQ